MIKNYKNFIAESVEIYGKGVLLTFFKCLTALGFSNNESENKNTPSEFLIIFKMSGVESSKIESVFKRFKSLSSIKIDYTNPEMGLYFGIRTTGVFEYGYYYDELIPIGNFKLNKSNLNYIKLIESKSASGIKRKLIDLSVEDILLMCKIKTEMDKFNPGFFDQKMAPIVTDKIIQFGYFGHGNWNQGVLADSDLESFKNNLKTFLSKYKWSEKIQLNVSPNKFWIYVNIKLK